MELDIFDVNECVDPLQIPSQVKRNMENTIITDILINCGEYGLC